MKNKKTLIIISFAILIVCLNFIPLRYNNFIFRLNFGQVHITDYVGDSKELVIPEKILNFPVVSINGLNTVPEAKKITIEANIKEIKGRTLFSCINLKSITLPKTLKKIDVCYDANSDSPGLTFLEGCNSLKEICIDGENERFVSIDGVLYDKIDGIIIRCPPNKKGKVFVPDWVTGAAGIEYEYSPFDDCDKLASVSIPQGLKSIKDDLRIKPETDIIVRE